MKCECQLEALKYNKYIDLIILVRINNNKYDFFLI